MNHFQHPQRALKATLKAIKDLGYSIPGPWFLLTYSETLP